MSVQPPIHAPPPLPISTRDWVQDHPPFLRSSERFSKPDKFSLSSKPGQNASATADLAYHVAYGDVNRKTQRSNKGWAALDDPIKSGRGTSTGKHHSSMAPQLGGPPCGSSLMPLAAMYPNETRLQELITLQKRKTQAVPGPGAYEGGQPLPPKITFRRQQEANLDGPFFLGEGDVSARSKEIATVLRNVDSGLGPGEYDWSPSGKHGPSMKIGTSGRDGKSQNVKSLSISRSIAHSIDWHVPVILQPRSASEPRTTNNANANVSGGGGGGQSAGASGSDSPHSRSASPHGLFSQMENGPASPSVGDGARSDVADHGGGSNSVASFGGRPFALPPTDTSGMPPTLPPPAAVAKSVRRDQARLPGEWDWERLARMNRQTWANKGGGVYTHGERSSVVREVLHGDKQVVIDPYGQHPPVVGPGPGDAESAAGMFPIAEEPSGGAFDHEGVSSPIAERGPPPTSASGRPRTQTSSPATLSRQDLDRRSAAAAAAAHAQEVNVRRASWNQRSA